MDNRVQQSLSAALKAFESANNIALPEAENVLGKVFDLDAPFLDKVAALDAAFDDLTAIESLREPFFDLLLINFFTEDVKKLEEDYLDSPEWEDIEEQTIDRGTEILNLLLYLKECEDEEIEPSLEDYLKEFLLVDEDEFQDEHRIYEDVIANQVLTESSYPAIAEIASKLPASSEIGELFYPLMSFFLEPDPSSEQIESYIRNSTDPGFDSAVYAIFITYNPTN